MNNSMRFDRATIQSAIEKYINNDVSKSTVSVSTVRVLGFKSSDVWDGVEVDFEPFEPAEPGPDPEPAQ
jgi:hypothetical protein